MITFSIGDNLFIFPFLNAIFYRRRAIHAEAPEFVEMSTEQEILVTGIKVVDLLAPYAKGGKIGMFKHPALTPSDSFCTKQHTIFLFPYFV